MICPQCAKSFDVPPWRLTKARYCSNPCKFAAPRQAVDVERLKREAFTGDEMQNIAQRLEVSTLVARRSMERAGVYETWKEQRWL